MVFFFFLMRHDASAQNASPKKIRKFFFLFKRRHVGVFGCTIQEINLHLTFTLNPSGSYEFGSTRGYDFFFLKKKIKYFYKITFIRLYCEHLQIYI